MTPQKCLETRLRLNWTRGELAAAAGLAAPIVRLYEAGALEGFEACAQALECALYAAEATAFEPERPVRVGTWISAPWGQAAFAG